MLAADMMEVEVPYHLSISTYFWMSISTYFSEVA
jgi:hypothetical protein